MELSKLQRQIISRAAMVVLGLGLMYGGYRCVRAGADLRTEYQEKNPGRTARHDRRASGSGLPTLIGIVLIIAGAPFALAAVVPSSVFGRIMGPPNQIGLHDNPDRYNPRGRW